MGGRTKHQLLCGTGNGRVSLLQQLQVAGCHMHLAITDNSSISLWYISYSMLFILGSPACKQWQSESKLQGAWQE